MIISRHLTHELNYNLLASIMIAREKNEKKLVYYGAAEFVHWRELLIIIGVTYTHRNMIGSWRAAMALFQFIFIFSFN